MSTTLVIDFIREASTVNHTLDTISDFILKFLCKVTHGSHGYICTIEKESLKYISTLNMELYIKKQETHPYKSMQQFFVPYHLSEKWIIVPLRGPDCILGAIGIEDSQEILSAVSSLPIVSSAGPGRSLCQLRCANLAVN